MVSGSIAFSNEKQSIQNGTNLCVPTCPTINVQNGSSLSICPSQIRWLPKFGDNGIQGMTRSGLRRGQVIHHGYGGPPGTVRRRQTGISTCADLQSVVYLVARRDGMEASRRRRRFALVQPWNRRRLAPNGFLRSWLMAPTGSKLCRTRRRRAAGSLLVPRR